MTDPKCVFCKIATGAIPALRVWENDAVLAFLDVNPLAHGHLLLIPKDHHRDIRDTPADVLSEMSAQLPRLAAAVMNATGADGLNVLQNSGASSGQAVFHLHFHLIPRRDGDGLGYRWNAGTYRAGVAEDIQKQIVQALQG